MTVGGQLCGFHISYAVSGRSNRLHVLIGLPYKYLVEEAQQMQIVMRMVNTKGTCPFRKETIPLFPKYAYATDDDGEILSTCFSSAHRQGLTMQRFGMINSPLLPLMLCLSCIRLLFLTLIYVQQF